MNRPNASTLIEVPRLCASKLNPAGAVALLAIPFIAARGRMRLLLGLVALMLGGTLAAAEPVGCAPNSANYPCVYVANSRDGTVSVINATTGTVIATDTVTVGLAPEGVAVTPNNASVYVANSGDGFVEVIDTATNTIVGSIANLNAPSAVAIGPNGANAYVADQCGPNENPCVEV